MKDQDIIFNSKIANILCMDLDDFDKLILIEEWFKRFTKTQRRNLIKILEKKEEEVRTDGDRGLGMEY